jgi:hypothetical protein
MKIYISGKISGLEKHEYESNFELAEEFLKKTSEFLVTINPLRIKPFLGIRVWLCFMIADLWELRKCDAIYLQKNWVNSKGAVIEYFFARFIWKKKIFS